MTYRTDEDIMNRVQEHLDSALAAHPNLDWFVICLQGSQNYGISDEESDIDTKLLTIPSLGDLVLNKKPVSKVHIVEPTEEHCDMKDVREYFKIVRKQNINFVEIFFTNWYIVNPKYADLWDILKANAEKIARINPYRAIAAMRGMSLEKYHALEHEYPSRMPWIEKFGYDPKQLSHIFRIEAFMKAYLQNAYYKSCIELTDETKKIVYKVKRYGWEYYNSNKTYKEVADISLSHIEQMYQKAKNIYENKNNPEMEKLLDDVLYELISRSLKEELKETPNE